MFMRKPRKTFDVVDLISLICLGRKERYAFERHLALLTFSLWVLDPKDPHFVERGRFLGAAQIAKMLFERGSKRSSSEQLFLANEFSHERILTELLSEKLRGSFLDDIQERVDDAQLAARVASTFFLAPPPRLTTKRPSLNKAIHFIERGGFGPEYKSSPAAVKKVWVKYITAVPFFLADSPYFLDGPFLQMRGLSPHSSKWIQDANKILKNEDGLLTYFRIAKWIQERFYSLLDPATQRRFQFVHLPRQIEPTELSGLAFNEEQTQLYNAYTTAKAVEQGK
jgi:hypothetical protein